LKKVLLFFIVIILSSCAKQVDWTKVYESQKKSPFGLYIFKKELKQQHKSIDSNVFLDIKYNTEEFIDKEIVSYSKDSYFSAQNLSYIYINSSNYISDELAKKMFDISSLDNKIFISTHEFSDSFCYKLGINIKSINNTKYTEYEHTIENENYYNDYKINQLQIELKELKLEKEELKEQNYKLELKNNKLELKNNNLKFYIDVREGNTNTN
jgi:hypothetical protein